MATYSSILAGKIPQTEEPSGAQRVGHSWATSTQPISKRHCNGFRLLLIF